jgi:hypothetical protein
MRNTLTGKPMETRNLLAEKDMYQLFEFTSLRHKVGIVRDITAFRAKMVAFGRKIQESCSTTCTRETVLECIEG